MYAPFFGLKQAAFSIAPDPRFLFMSDAHREALAHLLYGVSGGGGFVLLTGEIGAGKTTVCRCFLDQIPPHCDVAYVFNPKLTVPELLQTVCDEFHIEVPPGALTVKDYVDPLNAFLLRSHAAGRSCVLIIDEAQSLSADVLEQLRLLTNLETAERKLLQIVLIGQPELRTLLARPELEQLAQRVIARYHLPALTERETLQYIRHRLSVAGLNGELPFDDAALRRIHALCGGVPRRVNLLCDRALLGGYASSRKHIGRDIVERAAREVFDTARQVPRRAGWAAALGGVVLLGLATAAVLALRPGASGMAAAPAASGTAVAGAPAAPAASDPASAADSSPAATVDAGTLLPQAHRSDASAWRALAQRWDTTLAEGEPCRVAALQQLVCHRIVGGLAGVRQLGRPGLLTVYDDQGAPAYLLLLGLGDNSATLRLGDRDERVTLASLARLWRGEFATLWRAPPGWTDTAADAEGGPLAPWLAEHLPAPDDGASAPLGTRLHAFQLAQGLKPDGLAGPLTLMQINRASGVQEPRLATAP